VRHGSQLLVTVRTTSTVTVTGPGLRVGVFVDDGAFRIKLKLALGSRGILSQVPGFSTITDSELLVGGGCHGSSCRILVLHWQVT
jgi:hypothetical protein